MRHVLLFVTIVVVLGTVASEAAHPARELWIPAAHRGPGIGGSEWRTDVTLFNPGGQTAAISLYWLERGSDNSAAQPFTYTLSPGRGLVFEDAISSVLGLAVGSGGFRVVASAPVSAGSRIYSLAPDGGSFGQGFEAIPTGAAISADGATSQGSETWVTGISVDSRFRANLYAVAVGTVAAEIEVRVITSEGAAIASGRLDLPIRGPLLVSLDQVTGGVALDNATVRFKAVSGAAIVGVSAVDNDTGDPTTLEAAWPLADPIRDGSYSGVVGLTVPGTMTLEIVDGPEGRRVETLAAGLVLLSPEDGGTGCADALAWVDDEISLMVDPEGRFVGDRELQIHHRDGSAATVHLELDGRLLPGAVVGTLALDVAGAGSSCVASLAAVPFELGRISR